MLAAVILKSACIWGVFQGHKWEKNSGPFWHSTAFWNLDGLSEASPQLHSLESCWTLTAPIIPTGLSCFLLCCFPSVSWGPLNLPTSADIQCLFELTDSPIPIHSHVKCPLPPLSFAYIVEVPQATSEIIFEIHMPRNMLLPSLYPTITQINNYLKTAFIKLWIIYFVPSHLKLLEAFNSVWNTVQEFFFRSLDTKFSVSHEHILSSYLTPL